MSLSALEIKISTLITKRFERHVKKGKFTKDIISTFLDRIRSDVIVNVISTMPDSSATECLEKCIELIDILLDDDNLLCLEILKNNCIINFKDFSKKIRANEIIFKPMFISLAKVIQKGTGVGELLMPLLFKNYHFTCKRDENDGISENGEMRFEIKKAGGQFACKLVLNKNNNIDIDSLNKTYFDGKCLSKQKDFLKLWPNIDFDDLQKYFENIWPSKDKNDIKELVESLKNVKSYQDFAETFGLWGLKEYKKVDRFTNMTIVEPDIFEIFNIFDFNDIKFLSNLSFTPVLSRGGDTNAIPDGYLKITKKRTI
jgi:hypothetical protein